MRKILLGAAMAAILAGMGAQGGLGLGAAQAQGLFSPVVYVNDSAVTEYEIAQRTRFMTLLRAGDTSRPTVEKALIDDRLRRYAAKLAGITLTDAQISAGLEEFAARGNLSVDQFVQQLSSAGVDRQTFDDFIVPGLLWRDYVRQRIVGRVQVTDTEVDQAMQTIIETPRVTSVALSELIIPAPQGQEAQAMALAESIVARTTSEAQFAAFARQYSATPSRDNGGRMPMVALTNLPPALRPIILQMQPGQISQPLSVQGAVVLFFLRDTHGTLRPGAEEQILDYVRVSLASTQEAARLAALSDTCADLLAQTGDLPSSQVIEQKLPQGQVPQGDAIMLASLDENETTTVNYGGAVQMLMLCKRSPAILANAPPPAIATAPGEEPPAPDPNAIPARADVQNQVFNRKVAQAAESELAELRANAIIRRPR